MINSIFEQLQEIFIQISIKNKNNYQNSNKTQI
jgi:hypothetical protein